MTDGELVVKGLQGSAEVIRDEWGVPHIYAASDADLFFAQGFVHAQDRLWQMELNRRTGRGTLSELFGKMALDTDRAIRTFGWDRLGGVDWSRLDGSMQTVIEAYVRGINAFIEHPSSKLPIEFSLLKHKPLLWSTGDVMALSRVMIWQLSCTWYAELVRARVAALVGDEHARELEVEDDPDNPVTLPNGIEFNLLDPGGTLRGASGPFLKRGKGSNAWAVSGAKSATGKPFLCNDMHLALGIPSLWYEVHLDGEKVKAAGVSLPGLPLVMVGHNDHIAWGITLAYTDCEDLFVEKMHPEVPGRYLFKDEWRDAETFSESIVVKGNPDPHIEKVVLTHHGPLISDIEDCQNQKIAVSSMALEPARTLDGWYLLNRAGGWNEFVHAATLIESPQFNVAYADVDGNIGYITTGRVPVRRMGNGMMPSPGWTGEFEWIGAIPAA